jgi:hypothetical protein
MKDLLIIVPTRSRPYNVRPVAEAWLATGAFDGADLLFAIDADDPEHEDYLEELEDAAQLVEDRIGRRIRYHQHAIHRQLVPKLNAVATLYAGLPSSPFAIGFAGDDHLPRTPGWAGRYLTELRGLGSGIVYPDDGYQGENLPTSWAMTSDIVRALAAMVPAGVEHLYCDDVIRDLGQLAGCLRYLPGVLVEHRHPAAGKADSDEQYERVNGRAQYRADRRAYREWRAHDLARQAGVVRALRTGALT